MSLCSEQAGGGAAVCADLPVIPRGRGVHDGQCGLLQRGAGTRWQTPRGQEGDGVEMNNDMGCVLERS